MVKISDPSKPVTDHLEELRTRILISVAIFLVFMGAGFFFVDPVLDWLAEPVGHFVFTSPTDALFIRMKIAAGLGFLAAFPVILYHTWRYMEVALFDKEKSIVGLVLPSSCLLFYSGMALAVFVVAPTATKLLIEFGSENLRPFISIQAYFSFLLWMVLGFGLLFQLPLFVVVLVATGFVKVKRLKQVRKHVILGLVVAAAFLTPGPDVFSQIIMLIPAYILFELSLLVAARFEKGKNT